MFLRFHRIFIVFSLLLITDFDKVTIALDAMAARFSPYNMFCEFLRKVVDIHTGFII